MARRSLTENGIILNFLAEDSSNSDYLCSKVELATTLERITDLKIKNMCSFGCEDDQGTEATRR